MSNKSRIFLGSYPVLQDIVKRTGIHGHWVETASGQKQFRTDTGGILNWWSKTGTVLFQGRLAPKQELESAFNLNECQLTFDFAIEGNQCQC